MTTFKINTTFAGVVAVGLIASSFAQAAGEVAAAAPAATPAMSGPLIAGVCLLSQQTLVSRSKIGLAAATRLQELTHASQVEFDGEKRSIEARAKALGAKRPTTPAMQQQMQAQGQALNQRFQALQGEAQVRSRQLDTTRVKVGERIVDAAQPYIAPAFAAHNCGLLLAREAALGGNMGNDLTGEVIAAMDAKAAPLVVTLEPAAR